jgi:hypothetical protein
MQIPSAVAALLVFWYALSARNAMERNKREAALDEREAALDERQAQQDARQVKLLDIKAYNKEFRRKEKAKIAADHEKLNERATNMQLGHARRKAYYLEKKADLKYYDEQLLMKYKTMQAVIGVMQKVVDTYTCAITDEIFKDPVTIDSGHTYSREAIAAWFVDHDTCPSTRATVSKRLVPNFAMKKNMITFKEALPSIAKFNEAIKPPKKPPAAEAAADAGAAEAAAAGPDVDPA